MMRVVRRAKRRWPRFAKLSRSVRFKDCNRGVRSVATVSRKQTVWLCAFPFAVPWSILERRWQVPPTANSVRSSVRCASRGRSPRPRLALRSYRGPASLQLHLAAAPCASLGTVSAIQKLTRRSKRLDSLILLLPVLSLDLRRARGSTLERLPVASLTAALGSVRLPRRRRFDRPSLLVESSGAFGFFANS